MAVVMEVCMSDHAVVTVVLIVSKVVVKFVWIADHAVLMAV
jgi:hypothetical protein